MKTFKTNLLVSFNIPRGRAWTFQLHGLLTQLWRSTPTCSSSGRKYESGRVSLASCPLMAHPITRTWALHRTCAQEAWTYCCYTTETGYALFANLGSLSCPQRPSHHYKGDERRAQRMCELPPILNPTLVANTIGCKDISMDERLHRACGDFALLAKDSRTIWKSLQHAGRWVRDVWERRKRTGEAKG